MHAGLLSHCRRTEPSLSHTCAFSTTSQKCLLWKRSIFTSLFQNHLKNNLEFDNPDCTCFCVRACRLVAIKQAFPQFLDKPPQANIWLTSCIAERSRKVWSRSSRVKCKSVSWSVSQVKVWKEMSSEIVCYCHSQCDGCCCQLFFFTLSVCLSTFLSLSLSLSFSLSLSLSLADAHTGAVRSTLMQQGNTLSSPSCLERAFLQQHGSCLPMSHRS